jgi:signal transduction histidine kinase
MRSLRLRLFIVLLATFAVTWGITLTILGVQFSRERTGVWDRNLDDVAREILVSMPADVSRLDGNANLRLPGDAAPPPGRHGKLGRMVFQVWIKDRRHLVVHSQDPFRAPLRPDFVDGFATRTISGEEWRIVAISDARGEVQVQVGKPTADLVADLRRWVRIGLVTTLVLLLVLAAAMRLVIRWTLRPVTRVQEAITARNALDLQPLPGEHLPDEVRPLVESFNRLLGRLDRAMRKERQFLAEAAHELRTPLAALLAHAQVAQRSRSLEEARAPLAQLVRGVERSARLSQQLLDSARLDAERPPGERGPVELADLVAVITREFETVAATKCQTVTLDTCPSPIEGDVDELGILIGNLIDNALRYTPPGGRVAVRCRRDGDRVRLEVRDNGPGVPPEDRSRIFDRFFRVAGSNERGSGIGLSLVARIAESHGAVIHTGEGLDDVGFGIAVAFPALREGAPMAAKGTKTRAPAARERTSST